MRDTRSTLVFLMVILGCLWASFSFQFPVSGASESSLTLFSPAPEGRTEGLSRGTGPGRSAYMLLNPQALAELPSFSPEAAPQLVFEQPFAGALVFDVDAAGPGRDGSFSLTGQSPDGEAALTLAVSGEALYGSVTAGGAIYRFFPVEGDLYQIQALQPEDLPGEEPPLQVDLPAAPERDILAVSDDGSQIDLMVVYTPAAQSAVGGAAAMQALIAVAVAETNTGFANSLITPRVNLVYAAQVNYSEVNFDWTQALGRLQYNGDGYMDVVHSWRETYAADVVVLLAADASACGIAWLMDTPSLGFESYAFSAVSTVCATGYYSFGHELGHIMGGHHDRYQTSDDGAYAYSHAYLAPDFAFRTVLGYNCPGGCPRINHYSNPAVHYVGQPTGVHYQSPSSADNARTFNNTAWIVSNFRDGASPAAPSGLRTETITPTSVSLAWMDNSLNELGFTLERRLSAGGGWQVIGTPGANATSYTDGSLSAGTAYDYRIKAWNGNGESAYSTLTNIVTPLFAPQGVHIGAFSQSHIRLDWSDPNTQEDGTHIFRREDAGSPWTYLTTVSADITQMVDNDLQCGQAYDYRLVAFNETLESPAQVVVDAKTALCDPAGFSGTPISSYAVQLSWLDNNDTETDILLERRTLGGETWAVIASLTANQTGFLDDTAMCQTTYQYRMRTYNGVGYSNYSSPILTLEMGICTEYPEIPLNLTAQSTFQSVLLSWEDCRYETGYELQRTPVGSDDWSTIALLPMDTTSYTDHIARNAVPYHYRIRSINPLGESAFSPAIQVDTFPFGAFMPFITSGW